MAVKLFGHTVSTPAAVAIAGGSAIAIWFAYKQHKASAASASTTSSSAIDPVTGLPYSQDNVTDPLTGMTYLAEAQEYGSVSAAEQAAAGSAGDALTSEYGSSGLSGIGSSGSTSLEAVPGGYTSNAQWAQAVTAGLSAIGYSATDVAAALGLYLGSLPLSTLADGVSSAQIVSAALAEYGPPPVGTFTMIAAGATPPITTVPPTIQPSPGGTVPPTVPPPAAKKKYATDPPSGFNVSGVTKSSAHFSWTKQGSPCTGYAFTIYDGATLVDNRPALSASTSTVSSSILKPSHKYTAKLRALPEAPGADGASISFTTPKA